MSFDNFFDPIRPHADRPATADRFKPLWWDTPPPQYSGLGTGKRRPLLIRAIGGFPASYWPNGS
jgi:hypothetical protein